MFVASPVFPISFKIEQVAKAIEEILRKKNWRRFEAGEIKLVLTPFYVFYYNAVIEKDGKPTGEEKRGNLALNGETAELSSSLAESMPEESKLVRELPDDYPLVVRKPIFSKHEAEKIALLKTCSLLKEKRENIVLSNFHMIYYPLWLAFVTIAGQNHKLEISAVTGQLFDEEKVPEKEKGFVEVTRQTLQELKQPGAWLQYSKEIAEIAGEKLAGREEKKSSLPEILRKPGFWLISALLVILVAVALYL